MKDSDHWHWYWQPAQVVPLADLPYLNATTCQWARHESLHNPTAPNPPCTMTLACPAVDSDSELPVHWQDSDVARVRVGLGLGGAPAPA